MCLCFAGITGPHLTMTGGSILTDIQQNGYFPQQYILHFGVQIIVVMLSVTVTVVVIATPLHATGHSTSPSPNDIPVMCLCQFRFWSTLSGDMK